MVVLVSLAKFSMVTTYMILKTICVIQYPIFTRDSIYAIASICHDNSVCLPHACFVSKRLNVSSKFFHSLIGPSLQFFITKGRCSNLMASPITGAKYKGVAIFDQYAAISPKGNRYRHSYCERRIKSYVLYRIVPLSMTLNNPEPQFKGHSIV